MRASSSAGCFGKLRGNGDFVARRLPPSFVEPWDAMLQAGMLASRAALGREWPGVYSGAPLWCFALGGGVAGESGWAGVLMPSVDSVGRHFPLTIAAPVDARTLPSWLPAAGDWFARCAELALSTLHEGSCLAGFDAGLLALPEVSAVRGVSTSCDACAQGTSVWWTEGSETLLPSMRGCPGLPDAASAAGLFDGRADGWPWHRPLSRGAGI
jgi:type VI secretion system protein ImpM